MILIRKELIRINGVQEERFTVGTYAPPLWERTRAFKNREDAVLYKEELEKLNEKLHS